MRFRLLVVVLSMSLGCQALPGRGSPCTRPAECGESLVCALGACRGACRATRDCQIGERCLVEPSTGLDVCSVDVVDDCTTHACPTGLVCAGGECVNACGTVVRCPDGVCEGDVCRALVVDGGVDDAGPGAGDAAVLDAGPRDAGPDCHGPGCDPIVQIALAATPNGVEENSAYALTASGALWAWGFSATGLLGDRVVTHGSCAECAPSPVRVLGPDGLRVSDAVEVRAGSDVCVRRRDGSVWCWGPDYALQRGDGARVSTDAVPTVVVRTDPVMGEVPLDEVVALRVAGTVGCAIRGTAREVWCWGSSDTGLVGDGVSTASAVAIPASAFGTGVTDLDLSDTTAVARYGGMVRGLGDDACAQLGVPATDPTAHFALVDAPVAAATDVALAAGNACALGASGLECWGGDGPVLGAAGGPMQACPACVFADCTAVPRTIAQPEPFVSISGHAEASFFGVTAGGALYAWGGQYRGPFEGVTAPIAIAIPEPVAEAAVAGTVGCARTTLGDVYCWGGNAYGQLGRGVVSVDGDPTPARVVWP